jgi:pilus assembly protein Flp/PilA
MNNLIRPIERFLKSEDGPTAVEYAVMLALIIVACLVIVGSLGQSVSSTFQQVNDQLGGTTGGGTTP